MSKLNHSAKDNIDVLLIECTYASLVIVSSNNNLYKKCKHTGIAFSCTMTEFKKGAVSLYDLQTNKGIGKVLHRIDWDDSHILELWTRPGHIRAQTYADMDYRKEWYGGNCYYEGNNYGDTSDFYMIGRIVSKKNNISKKLNTVTDPTQGI